MPPDPWQIIMAVTTGPAQIAAVQSCWIRPNGDAQLKQTLESPIKLRVKKSQEGYGSPGVPVTMSTPSASALC